MIPTPSLKVNPSRREVWAENFEEVKRFYEENGHLTMPKDDPNYARLSQWLTYQRHRSKSLRKEQLEMLESINYNNTRVHRETDDEKWMAKYSRLKQLVKETGALKIPVDEHALANWLSRQRKLLGCNFLDPGRKEMLVEIGVHPVVVTGRNDRRRRRDEERWMAQFEKLKEYNRVHGDCNVPRQWKHDPSLGSWVHNQRKRYHEGRSMAGVVMFPDRVEKLEELGFKWTIHKRHQKV